MIPSPVFRMMAALVCALGAMPGMASQQAESAVPANTERLGSLLGELERIAMFNGHVIVDRGGDRIFDRSYGNASYELEVPITSETRFRIASLSKTMTEAALANLVAQGRLSLDMTVDRFLPDFPRGAEITIGHLIEHQSGIAHSNSQPWGDGSQSLTLDEIIARLAQLPLDFDPGSERSYSNGGYAVLTRILEIETGQSYDDLMDALVFTPLGMRDSGAISDWRAAIPGLATGYEPGPAIGSRRHSRPYAVETRPGGGSLYSTPEDLLTFFRAVFRDNYPTADVNRAVFGDPEQVRYSDGRSPGFYGDVRYEPETDLLVVSIANNYAAEFAWAQNIARLATGGPALFADVPEIDRTIVPGAQSPLIGPYRYENPNFSQQLEIRANADGQLFIDDAVSDSRAALIPLADGGFIETFYFGICRSVDGDADRIRCTRWHDGGFTADIIRRAE